MAEPNMRLTLGTTRSFRTLLGLITPAVAQRFGLHPVAA